MLKLQAHTNLITNSRYLVKKFLREKLTKCVQGVSSNCILDVGCGEKPYTKFFPNSKYYFGIDRRSRSADVKAIGSIYRLMVPHSILHYALKYWNLLSIVKKY